jgi:hypothetical protein
LEYPNILANFTIKLLKDREMICIYHRRDLDGWMSGAIVKNRYPDVELVGWDYGDDIPQWESVIDGHKVVMVDISFPHDVMELYSKYNDLVWIDHHISAIKDNDSTSINGLRDTQKAACELTWEYFFPDVKMPEVVRLLGRYDCFGHKGTKEERKVLEFQYGARQLIADVDNAHAVLVACRFYDDKISINDPCEDILLAGKAIYKYLCTEAQQIYKRKFDVIFDGYYKFACVNQERFNPINFGINYHKDGYDGFACFHYQNGQWSYSLYNDNGDVDCSLLAKKRSGGGHKGAAGFRSDFVIL